MRIISAKLLLLGWLGLGVAGCSAGLPEAETSQSQSGGVTNSAPNAPQSAGADKANSAAQPSRRDGVSFLAFGDAGYLGSGNSMANVAAAMRQHCQREGCDFGLAAGDNIYPQGADGARDRSADLERFRKVFVEPFGDYQEYTSADFRFYMALGNHDWYTSRAGAFAQIDFHEQTPPFFMKGPFYSVRPPSGQGRLEVFVLDTEMLLASVMVDAVKIRADGSVQRTGGKKPGGWKDALPQTQAEKDQLQWFKTAIAQSSADWKLVLAHHPLWESKGSKFAQAEALRGLLMPTLCAHADAWFAGHQHTLEVHEISCPKPGSAFSGSVEADALADPLVAPHKLLHVVSGAASKARSVSPEFSRWQASTHPQLNSLLALGDTQGFVHAKIVGDSLKLQVFGAPAASTSPDEIVELFVHQFDNRSASQ